MDTNNELVAEVERKTLALHHAHHAIGLLKAGNQSGASEHIAFMRDAEGGPPTHPEQETDDD